MSKSDFLNKPVLVTGANGFIGSHITHRLLAEGAKVHVLLRKGSNEWRIREIINKLTVWQGDLNDYSSLRFCLKNARPRVIFHLAATRNVSRDIELIEQIIDNNLKGTVNLLKAAFAEKIALDCFINTGSSEEYGDCNAPFTEDQRECPVSPYSAGKVATTYFCQMLHKTMGLPVVTLRPFLTYGPKQDTDMFVPSLIQHCINGKNFMMTEGSQTREFNYIEDIVEAYMLAAENRDAIGEIFNIGNGIEYSIRDVAEKILHLTESPIKLLAGALQKRPGEAAHFFCSNQKAKEILGWDPRTDLQRGLMMTIKWYKKNFHMENC